MKLHVIDYGHNSDLPDSVLAAIPDDAGQTTFRAALNRALMDGKSEMNAFVSAWKALKASGYEQDGQQWVKKDAPTVGDVHVDQPIGGKKPKRKDDPDADPADLEEFEEEGQEIRTAKLYVPPVEVQAAAIAAIAVGDGVADITEQLSKGEGVSAWVIELMASRTGPWPDCWGGPLAAKWAARVQKKLFHVKQDSPNVEIAGTIVKLDTVSHLVFGWFSIVTVDGRSITDTQGDRITPDTIENAAYDFVLNARTAGEMHENGDDGEVRGVGRLVESCVFTPEKVQSMVKSLNSQGINASISLNCIPWWGGMKIDDPATWQRVVDGTLKAWSIGGKGKRDA